MLLFWSIAALLVGGTLALLLWPLLKRDATQREPDARGATIAVYRDQKLALDAECIAGTLSPAERDAAVSDLARRAAEEVEAQQPVRPESKQRTVWAIAAVLVVSIPIAVVLLYGRFGNPAAVRFAAGRQG